MLTFEPRGIFNCEVPFANSPLAFLDLVIITLGLSCLSIGSGVGNGAGGAGGTGGGAQRWLH